MDYDFLNMGTQQFESLVQSLMQKLLGADSIIFGAGPDGGRELTYEGATDFPNPKNSWSGYWVIQAKYKSREDTTTDSFHWVKKNLSEEINDFIKKDRKLPDNYIFITNAVLTAAEKKGGRDKIQQYIKEQNTAIPNMLVIAYDELCRLIDNNLDVRSAYSHLLTPGDVLSGSLHLINRNESNTILLNKELRELESPYKRNYAFLLRENSDSLISIDFGSSFSLVACVNEKNEPRFIKSDKQQILVPTCITFFSNGTYIVGRPEYKKIKEAITIGNFKRELGRNKEYSVFKEKMSAEYLSELFLMSLHQNIVDDLGANPKKVLISKPTYFSIKQTNALVQAFQHAGFDVRRSISESSASTLNYDGSKYDIADTHEHLAIDFGGGTLDLSIITLGDNIYEIKESYGDNYLGGFDYDELIFSHCLSELEKLNIRISEIAKKELYYECERAKIELNNSATVSLWVRDIATEDGNLQDIMLSLSREKFETITSRLNYIIFTILQKISRSFDIKSILICGQAGRLFTIQNIINYLFHNIPIIDAYADNAVIKGLVKYAAVMEGKLKDALLLDTIKDVIAVKCLDPAASRDFSPENNKSEFEGDINNCTISTTADSNNLLFRMIEHDTTIPTKNKNEFKLLNKTKSDTLWLEFFELERTTNEYEFLGKYCLPGVKDATSLFMTIDVDSNSTIRILIETDCSQVKNCLLINNFHLSAGSEGKLE